MNEEIHFLSLAFWLAHDVTAALYMSVTDGRTDGRTDGQTDTFGLTDRKKEEKKILLFNNVPHKSMEFSKIKLILKKSRQRERFLKGFLTGSFSKVEWVQKQLSYPQECAQGLCIYPKLGYTHAMGPAYILHTMKKTGWHACHHQNSIFEYCRSARPLI